MPHEREQTVFSEAEAAFEAGNYDEWFHAQSPKDRAHLVSTGKHAAYSKEKALPKPEPTETRVKQDPEPEDPEETKRAEQRKNWVDLYVENVDKAKNRDALANLQVKHKATLDRFRNEYPALWEKIESAHGRAFERVMAVNEDSGDDLFGDDGQ